MKNSNLFGSEEDLFQKSLHQEADFYKGLSNYNYDSLFMFLLGSLMAEFFWFLGFLFLGLLLAGIINAYFDGAWFYTSFIMGISIIFLMTIFLFFLGYKISNRLLISLKSKGKKFKAKTAIILLILPTLIAFFFLIIFYLTILPIMGFKY